MRTWTDEPNAARTKPRPEPESPVSPATIAFGILCVCLGILLGLILADHQYERLDTAEATSRRTSPAFAAPAVDEGQLPNLRGIER